MNYKVYIRPANQYSGELGAPKNNARVVHIIGDVSQKAFLAPGIDTIESELKQAGLIINNFVFTVMTDAELDQTWGNYEYKKYFFLIDATALKTVSDSEIKRKVSQILVNHNLKINNIGVVWLYDTYLDSGTVSTNPYTANVNKNSPSLWEILGWNGNSSNPNNYAKNPNDQPGFFESLGKSLGLSTPFAAAGLLILAVIALKR